MSIDNGLNQIFPLPQLLHERLSVWRRRLAIDDIANQRGGLQFHPPGVTGASGEPLRNPRCTLKQ